jgi:hypothetical protein
MRASSHGWVILLTLSSRERGNCPSQAAFVWRAGRQRMIRKVKAAFRKDHAQGKGPWSTVMDWQTYGLHVEPPQHTDEDEFAYAAGWTISGLATLGTIIAVWIFAI